MPLLLVDLDNTLIRPGRLHRCRPWPLTAFEPSHLADSCPHAVDIVLAIGE